MQKNNVQQKKHVLCVYYTWKEHLGTKKPSGQTFETEMSCIASRCGKRRTFSFFWPSFSDAAKKEGTVYLYPKFGTMTARKFLLSEKNTERVVFSMSLSVKVTPPCSARPSITPYSR